MPEGNSTGYIPHNFWRRPLGRVDLRIMAACAGVLGLAFLGVLLMGLLGDSTNGLLLGMSLLLLAALEDWASPGTPWARFPRRVRPSGEICGRVESGTATHARPYCLRRHRRRVGAIGFPFFLLLPTFSASARRTGRTCFVDRFHRGRDAVGAAAGAVVWSVNRPRDGGGRRKEPRLPLIDGRRVRSDSTTAGNRPRSTAIRARAACLRSCVGAEAASAIVKILRHQHVRLEIDQPPHKPSGSSSGSIGVTQMPTGRPAARNSAAACQRPSNGGAFGSNACRTSSLSVGIERLILAGGIAATIDVAHHQRAASGRAAAAGGQSVLPGCRASAEAPFHGQIGIGDAGEVDRLAGDFRRLLAAPAPGR